MKKMKFVAMGMIAAMSLSLVGCGSSGVTEESSVATGTTQNVSEESVVEKATQSEKTTQSEALRTEYPLTIEVYNGESDLVTMTFEKAPERVVSTQLSMTELMIELGLEDKIVGVFENDNALTGQYAEKIAQMNNLGDKKSVSKEAIVALEPDIILGKGPLMFADTSIGTVEYYQKNGIGVYTEITSANIEQSLDNVIQDVINMGIIFDVQEKANEYAKELEEKLNAVKEKVSVETGKTKTVLLMAGYNDGSFVAFNSAFNSCVLDTLNAVNVLDKGGNGLTSENLVALNPDYIIYVNADRFAEVDKTAIDSIYANEAIQTVTAVANKKILEIPYDDVMDYGARNIDALEKLYQFMYE